jgi:voltage-gated potassium channel
MFGHGGIDKLESEKAKSFFKKFSTIRLAVLMLLILQWYLELHDIISLKQSRVVNLAVWAYFVSELYVMLRLTKNKTKYLSSNWLSPLFCASGIVLLFFPNEFSEYFRDGVRLILIIWLIIPWVDVCFDTLSDNRLSTTIITTLSIIFFSGIIISGLDPNINTAIDGVWWAWVTVTTVGYGDIVPVSLAGRAFGFVLILVGTILFSALTANFSAIFTKRRLKKGLISSKDDAEIKKIVKEIKEQLRTNDVTDSIKNIEKRLTSIEKSISNKKKKN